MSQDKNSDLLPEVDHQARLWFERLHLLDHTPDQQQLLAFKQWLQAKPLHAKRYKLLEQMWRDMPLVDNETAKPANKPAWLSPLFAIAASLFVVCVCLFVFMRSPQVSQHYATKVGETQTISLTDGSLITLGAKSSLVATLSDKHRQVELISGQAYFDIAHKKNVPFTIQASQNTVMVLGTEFEIKTNQRSTKVAVKQGLVAVDSPSQQDIRLTAGQQVSVNKQGQTEVKLINNNDSFNWQQGQFSYVDIPLSEVLADINRYRKTPVKLEDQQLGQLKVTTAFKVEQIEQMLAGLAYSEDLQLSELGFITLLKQK